MTYRSQSLTDCCLQEGRARMQLRYPATGNGRRRDMMRTGARMLDLLGMDDSCLSLDRAEATRIQPYIATLRDVNVFGEAGLVYFDGRELVSETLTHTDPARDGYERSDDGSIRLPAPARSLPGRHLSLLMGNSDNHFHGLLMNYARLGILDTDERACLDGILIPAGIRPPHLELLQFAGVFRDKAVTPVHRTDALHVDSLVLPWHVASGEGFHPRALAFVRDTVPHSEVSAGHRLYIERRAAPIRKLLNEADVIDALRHEGIEPVQMEGLSIQQQAGLMRGATLVVAPHGAGLANLVFAAPDTSVVELMPSGYVNWCYRHLAAECALDYDCVVGRTFPVSGLPSVAAPWIVSPTHVLSAVRSAEAARAQGDGLGRHPQHPRTFQ